MTRLRSVSLTQFIGVMLASLALSAGTQAQGAAAVGNGGSLWAALSPLQQQALAPLQHDWDTLDAPGRQKWLELAARFPKMPVDERKRVQERMVQWARLTPAQRTQARMQFQEVRQLPAEERHAKWQAYQALSDGERQELAHRAKPASKAASSADTAHTPRPLAEHSLTKVRQGASPIAIAPASRALTPIVVHARPGATTTTLSLRPTPAPMSNLPGAPKIAATPGFVDPATLLPRHGPQRAANSASAASAAK